MFILPFAVHHVSTKYVYLILNNADTTELPANPFINRRPGGKDVNHLSKKPTDLTRDQLIKLCSYYINVHVYSQIWAKFLATALLDLYRTSFHSHLIILTTPFIHNYLP
ncbi:uncharacterized protein [Rhodnius prolixus]|uniref:uncharacterized protein n=1 Tax=Rhodnius prolixus TaxID=13249 RepID=UPI003D18AE60